MTSALSRSTRSAADAVDGAVGGLVERLGHVFGRVRGDDRHARSRGVATVTQAGAGAQRALRGEHRRAGLAARPGDDQHAAEIALVRVGGARR